MGKILFVDLSNASVSEELVPDHVYEQYLSGMGLAAQILYERIPAKADPLGPDNMIGFVSGLLTGTGSLFTGRWMVVGKSPLTGTWGDANCGGALSPAIKRCGYDGIFIRGMSDKPVYLHIDNGRVEIRDASHLWGKDTIETEESLIKEATGSNPQVACIGPAGEKLSLIAGISTARGRMAARSGLGAIMGAKKLKAIVLCGAKRIESFDREAIKKLSAKCNRSVQMQPPFIPGRLTSYVGALMRGLPMQLTQDGMLYKIMLRRWGTVGMNQVSIEMGDSPLKNWKGSNVDFGPQKSVKINPDVFTDCEVEKYHCYSCPLGCGGICSIRDRTKGQYEETHKPEYETVLSLGGLLMNEDVDSIFYLNEMLNRAGMDTISAGSSVAFALECYEQGLITREDADGLDLTWGNSEAIIALIQKMIKREGLGDILADGSKIAAQKIGRSAAQYAMHAGGQDLPMHDGRLDPGFNLHYSAEAAPGKHTIGSQLYYEMFQLWKQIPSLPKPPMLYHKNKKYTLDEEKAKISAACSSFMNIINGSGLCLFGAFLGINRTPTFAWLNAATGWNKTPEQYMEIGKRIQTLKQCFNLKHGVNPMDNIVPDRVAGKPPQAEGANKGRSTEVLPMLRDYWQQFGWDLEGKPLAVTLDELQIKDPDKSA
jgi:aldehyde:ferredoxin oxidoreductase